jgi:hypothetical protein
VRDDRSVLKDVENSLDSDHSSAVRWHAKAGISEHFNQCPTETSARRRLIDLGSKLQSLLRLIKIRRAKFAIQIKRIGALSIDERRLARYRGHSNR